MLQWIDIEARKETAEASRLVEEVQEKLVGVQQKLDKLLEGYLDGVIDPESYRSKKEQLIQQKLALKSQKEALQKKRLPLWIEPTKDFVKTLEMAGKIDSVENLNEISSFMRKIGTNRLIADKNVLFEWQKPFDFTASSLASLVHARSASPVEIEESSVWCA